MYVCTPTPVSQKVTWKIPYVTLWMSVFESVLWFMFFVCCFYFLSCCSLCSSFSCPSSHCFFLSSYRGWWGTPALHLPAINPLYIPSLDFYSVPEYLACLVISWVYSCCFRVSRTVSFCVFFLIMSLLCFCSGYVVCLRQPRLCPALGSSCDFWFSLVCSASLLVLSFCCYFVSFLECRAQSPFPLLVALRIVTGIFTDYFCCTLFCFFHK